MITIGQRIKELREQRGWSQDQLAEKLDMNRANISNYERGIITNIPSDVITKLADVFQKSTDYILCRTSDDGGDDVPAAPDWATSKDKRDVKKFIESPEILYYDGVKFSEEDKAKMIGVMEAIAWEAKRQNKEAYKKSRAKKNS
ncbi:helix-turn-helix transcriptional regulator [Brevibacillus centrosporus]|uniref:helix-turn-helix domain-containing protein n=1 Tax=Brevibacillus centrosporus TaxID=54910 RepID=UPI000F0A8F6C|nr:helix-turn-helix transcriptional regulator [Brevibacillus centrosporus]MEC2133488.1 helix-turn-helix transcriptional regulator [Brevibacillus centrosporus]RNB68554.1 XRE family transcriptional regulator [Brevibacillus centrosporus]GED35013.1 hypothetical protein BCE02nite_61540 [Brevibacillus centrosporus]